jgi:hypothetical protein
MTAEETARVRFLRMQAIEDRVYALLPTELVDLIKSLPFDDCVGLTKLQAFLLKIKQDYYFAAIKTIISARRFIDATAEFQLQELESWEKDAKLEQ